MLSFTAKFFGGPLDYQVRKVYGREPRLYFPYIPGSYEMGMKLDDLFPAPTVLSYRLVYETKAGFLIYVLGDGNKEK